MNNKANGVIINGVFISWNDLSPAQITHVQSTYLMPIAIRLSKARETIRRMEGLYDEKIVRRLARIFKQGSKFSLKSSYQELEKA